MSDCYLFWEKVRSFTIWRGDKSGRARAARPCAEAARRSCERRVPAALGAASSPQSSCTCASLCPAEKDTQIFNYFFLRVFGFNGKPWAQVEESSLRLGVSARAAGCGGLHTVRVCACTCFGFPWRAARCDRCAACRRLANLPLRLAHLSCRRLTGSGWCGEHGQHPAAGPGEHQHAYG